MNNLVRTAAWILAATSAAADALVPMSVRAPELPPMVTGDGASGGGLLVAGGTEPNRYVIFSSAAANLVTNSVPTGAVNVYRRDRLAQRTELLSLTPSGGVGTRPVVDFSATRDGHRVVFVWGSNDTSAGDTNDSQDVYLWDATARATRLVSVRADRLGAGNGDSTAPALAEGGRFVAFESRATDLVASVEDTNRVEDIFLRDLDTGVTELISATPSGRTGDRPSQRPLVSADGNRVVFVSDSALLAPLDALATDLIVWNRGRSELQRVVLPGNLSPPPRPPSRPPLIVAEPVLSTDGRYLAFAVGTPDSTVWWMDLSTGDLRRASEHLTVPGFSLTEGPSMSEEGRTLAFTVLVGDPNQSLAQVRVWTPEGGLKAMAELQLTVPPTGGEPATSSRPVLAGDAASLIFFTASPVPEAGVDEDDGSARLYHRVLATGQTRLVADEDVVFAGEISPDGESVLWETTDPVLDPGDDNRNLDVVVTRLRDGHREVVSVIAPHEGPAAAVGSSTSGTGVSDDGRFVGFLSTAEDLVVGDTNRMPDGFVFDASDGRNHRITAAPGDTGIVARPKELVVSRNGRFAAFVTAANGWTDGDTNTTADVYVRDLVRGTTALASARDGTEVSLDLVPDQVQLSGDGRWAIFRATPASDFRGSNALYLRDLVSRKTTLLNAPGRLGSQEFSGLVQARYHQLSVDAKTVLFINSFDWWLHVEGQTNLIPLANLMTSPSASLSPDGRRVAWLSRASEEPGLRIREVASGEDRVLLPFPQDAIRDLVFSADGAVLTYVRRSDPAGPPAENPWQVWALAIATGSEELISQTLSGSHGAGDSRTPQISADGRFIVFRTAAPGLVASDDGGTIQVVVRDRYTQRTHRLSEFAEGIPGNWHSMRPEISGDGRFAAFTSFANNLFPGDGNGLEDVFLASIPQEPAPDSDNDGLPDGWERDRFGNLTRDGTADTDGDGQSDAEEWQARTDPWDARSRWEVEATFERGVPALRWVGHAGVKYRIERQESLSGSAWALAGDPQPGYEGIHSLPLGDEDAGGYYRVMVSQ